MFFSRKKSHAYSLKPPIIRQVIRVQHMPKSANLAERFKLDFGGTIQEYPRDPRLPLHTDIKASAIALLESLALPYMPHGVGAYGGRYYVTLKDKVLTKSVGAVYSTHKPRKE